MFARQNENLTMYGTFLRVCGGLVVSVLNWQTRGLGFKSRPGQKFHSRCLLHLLCPLANSATMSALSDETVRLRTGHQPSYAEAKKMMLPTRHTHSCPRASLIKGLLFLFFEDTVTQAYQMQKAHLQTY